MISFDEAVAIIAAQVPLAAIETVPVTKASGRVLAAACIAQVDCPPADISAMDGYAVRDADVRAASFFDVVGTAYPGTPFKGVVGEGQCVRLFTGAPIPPGADRVIIQENIRRDGDRAHIETLPGDKRHIRAQGIDFRVGDVLLQEGRLLNPRALVAAAASDLEEFHVWPRPRVAVIGTGDELEEPGHARRRPGSIPESGSFGVAALAESWGASVVDRQRLPDDIARMREGARAALDRADLVVVIGGASVGEKDYAKRVFVDLGAELLFNKVALMPGKPVWFGRAADRLVLGLPGNPTSAMVTARLFLAPLLAALGGRDPMSALRWHHLRIRGSLPSVGERETFVRARRVGEGVVAITNQDSGMQFALADADLLIRRPPRAEALSDGIEVDVLDF